MSSCIASHIPATISVERLQEFFSFCGVIKTINLLKEEDKFKTYEVNFKSEKAISTALLLNDAELDGVTIKVEENTDLPSYDDVPDKKPTTVVDNKDDNKLESTVTGDVNYDDVDQEEKPKYAIMAQLLAQGYEVSDNIIEKSISFDKEHGYSTKFKSFLSGLDEKYIHLNDPESRSSQLLGDLKTSGKSYYNKLGKYFDKVSTHPYGMKIHDFYKTLAGDVKDVHTEAKRLNELKKQEDLKSQTAEVNETIEKN